MLNNGLYEINFINCFKYTNKEMPITGFSINQNCILNGTNGAGKTTAASLIPFFYGLDNKQNAGSILEAYEDILEKIKHILSNRDNAYITFCYIAKTGKDILVACYSDENYELKFLFFENEKGLIQHLQTLKHSEAYAENYHHLKNKFNLELPRGEEYINYSRFKDISQFKLKKYNRFSQVFAWTNLDFEDVSNLITRVLYSDSIDLGVFSQMLAELYMQQLNEFDIINKDNFSESFAVDSKNYNSIKFNSFLNNNHEEINYISKIYQYYLDYEVEFILFHFDKQNSYNKNEEQLENEKQVFFKEERTLKDNLEIAINELNNNKNNFNKTYGALNSKKEDLSKIDKKINEILKSLDLKKFEEIKNNIDYIKKQLDFMENQKVPEVKNLEMIMSNNIKEIQEKHKEDQNILIAETNNKKINISSVIEEKATEILKINNNGIINNILKKINELKIYDIEDININNYSYYNILVEKQLDFNLNKLDNNLKKLIIEKQGIQKNIDNIKKKLNDNSIYSFIQKESKNPEKIICLLSDKILEKESNGLEVIQNNLTKTILDISFNNMEFFDNIDNKISKQEQLNNYLDQLSSLNNAIEEIKQLKNKEEERYLEFIIFLSKNILEINNIENQVSDLKKIILVLEDKIKNIEIEFSKNLTIMNNNLELDINKQKSTLKEQINLLNVYSDNNRLFDELKSKSAYYNLNLNKYYTYISLTENKLEVEDVLLNLNIEYENKKKIVDQKDENVLDIKNQINSIKEKYNKTINILNEIKAKLEAELGITNKILSDNNRYLPNILDERQFLDGIEFNNLKEFNLQSFYNNFKEIKNFIEKSELFHKIKNDGILNFLFQEDFSKKGIVNSQLSKLNQYSIYRSELFVFSKIDKETEYALSDINTTIETVISDVLTVKRSIDKFEQYLKRFNNDLNNIKTTEQAGIHGLNFEISVDKIKFEDFIRNYDKFLFHKSSFLDNIENFINKNPNLLCQSLNELMQSCCSVIDILNNKLDKMAKIIKIEGSVNVENRKLKLERVFNEKKFKNELSNGQRKLVAYKIFLSFIMKTLIDLNVENISLCIPFDEAGVSSDENLNKLINDYNNSGKSIKFNVLICVPNAVSHKLAKSFPNIYKVKRDLIIKSMKENI